MSIFSGLDKEEPHLVPETDFEEYEQTRDGFRNFLQDLGDELFPFPGYREYQDEIMHETLEAFFLEEYTNVIVEGPTGIGKSPFNVGIGRVAAALYTQKRELETHFSTSIGGLLTGKTFYTTPQKQLRNQLAEDDDLREYVSMLKSRRDYTCGVSGSNCSDCPVRASPDQSCREMADCTYWDAKTDAMDDSLAVITFAMQIVDNYVPEYTEGGDPLSFGIRDIVVVDEGHNGEGQAASLFAGFTLSPWSVPEKVYADAGEKVDWNADRFEDIEDLLVEIKARAEEYITRHEENEQKQSKVEECEDVVRKIEYCLNTARDGRGWVCNVDEVAIPGESNATTKKIQVKPVRVNDFLQDYVWSRGRRRLITSATIPFRDNVSQWGDRLGLDGNTKFISKPTPFPKEHRQIHLNTMVGPMSGDDEDKNWGETMRTIREIHSHHQGEKGLIHSVSYKRAQEVGEAIPEAMVHDADKDQDAMITKWQNSDKDILVSPTMMQGVDLHGDLCRWQVLLKVPYAYMGDERVSYLLHEENEWDWYMEKAAMNIIQAVGRAVRGPEPEEAASFYVIDSKFDDVFMRTSPPEYFVKAIEDDAPEHWENPDAAPWR